MHIELDKEALVKNLELISKITTKHQSLPVLQCVRVTASSDGTIALSATNLELSMNVRMQAAVSEEGEVAVPANLLLQTIQLLTPKQVVLRVTGDVLLVESKVSKTKIKTFATDEFPRIAEISTDPQVINGSMFAYGIKTAAFATSQSTVKPELGSVYVSQKKEHTLTFVATDSFRLVEKTVPQQGVTLENPILIPQKNAQEIARVIDIVGEDPEFMVGENQAAFRFAKGIYIATRLTEGSFPDYQQIIPKEYKTHVTLLVSDLEHALKKTNIFANRFMQVGFAVQVKAGILTLTSDNSDVGQTTEDIKMTGDGDDLTLSFNQRYVSDPLSFFATESITLNFAGIGRPMVIEGVNDQSLRYLVMPMNK